MAWYRQRDKSEGPIVEMLKAHGWTVQRVSARNFGDLVICKGSRTAVVEVKSGTSSKLRPGQQRWFESWPGEKYILRSPADVEGMR